MIRITAQQTYLGAVLSYSKFEMQTAELRFNQANRVSHLLNKWLMGRTGLTMKHKFNVWCMCVFTCLTHGLLYTGVTIESLTEIDIFIMKQLRRLYRSPVHIDRLTNSQFVQHYRIKDPLSQFFTSCCKTVRRLHLLILQLHANDVARNVDLDKLEAGLVIVQKVIQLRRQLSTTVSVLNQADAYTCTICDASFSRQSDLRGHQRRMHGIQSGRLYQEVYPLVNCVKLTSHPGAH